MSYAGYAGKRLSSDKPSIPQCLLFLFFKKRNRTPSFLFRRKTGRYAREAQPLRRTDAGTSCVVVGRNTAAGMPPSSALSLPVSAAPARHTKRMSSFLFRRKEAKENRLRNSCLSVLLPFSPTRCTKRTVQMRTVRFYVLSRTCGKPPFLRKTSSPAVSFVSFLQEKKSSPFKKRKRPPLEEKKNVPFNVLPPEKVTCDTFRRGGS